MTHKLVYLGGLVDEPLVCSQCDATVEMVVTIPLLGAQLDPSAWTKEEDAPWIGLCETCVAEMHHGFAKAKGQATGVASIFQGRHRCPACRKMTRDTTAGCDHCDFEDK
jgi:hypothetical protein